MKDPILYILLENVNEWYIGAMNFIDIIVFYAVVIALYLNTYRFSKLVVTSWIIIVSHTYFLPRYCLELALLCCVL